MFGGDARAVKHTSYLKDIHERVVHENNDQVLHAIFNVYLRRLLEEVVLEEVEEVVRAFEFNKWSIVRVHLDLPVEVAGSDIRKLKVR